MPDSEEYRRRAEMMDRRARALPEGFERNEALRLACALHDLADQIAEHEQKQTG